MLLFFSNFTFSNVKMIEEARKNYLKSPFLEKCTQETSNKNSLLTTHLKVPTINAHILIESPFKKHKKTIAKKLNSIFSCLQKNYANSGIYLNYNLHHKKTMYTNRILKIISSNTPKNRYLANVNPFWAYNDILKYKEVDCVKFTNKSFDYFQNNKAKLKINSNGTILHASKSNFFSKLCL